MHGRQPTPIDSAEENGRPAVGKETSPRPRRQSGVLIVEDDSLVRIMLQAGLERHGFQVWLAANGREAISLLRQHGEAIAVVLLDVRRPGEDGLQTLESLRKRGADVVACFTSGDTGAREPDELLRRGARYVFVTPLCLDDMANILRLLAHGVPANLLPPCTATVRWAREGCAS